MDKWLDDCYRGDYPSPEQIRKIRTLAQSAEPAVRRYLEECACCFAAGAYSASIVMAWNAAVCYLRQVIELIGYEVCELYYGAEDEEGKQPFKEQVKRSDRPIYKVYQRMKLCEDGEKVAKLDDFYNIRNEYAHPTGSKATAQEAFNYICDLEWLVTRRLNQERFQTVEPVLRYAEETRKWDKQQAKGLVIRVHERQRGTLATRILEIALSEDRNIPLERLSDLWDALKPLLPRDLCKLIMKKLVEIIRSGIDIDGILDVGQMARFICWEAIQGETNKYRTIWEYFVERLDDPNMSIGIAATLKKYAPSPYREKIEAKWPNI